MTEVDGVVAPGLEEGDETLVEEFPDNETTPDDGLLKLSPDIPVPLTVVMGRKRVTVKDLLELRSGQVVEMEQRLGEPVEIVAAGKVIAKGELVDVEGKLGVRVLQLLK